MGVILNCLHRSCKSQANLPPNQEDQVSAATGGKHWTWAARDNIEIEKKRAMKARSC